MKRLKRILILSITSVTFFQLQFLLKPLLSILLVFFFEPSINANTGKPIRKMSPVITKTLALSSFMNELENALKIEIKPENQKNTIIAKEEKIYTLLEQHKASFQSKDVNHRFAHLILNSIITGNTLSPSDEYNELLVTFYKLSPLIFNQEIEKIDPESSAKIKLMLEFSHIIK